jgi:two-component system NtrC family sensor kinase
MASQIGQALEKIQLYATIEQSAARYRDLYENANDFIGTMTMNGLFTSLNRAALQFLGYDEADVSHLSLSDLMPQNNARQPNDVLNMLQSREAARGVSELQVIRKNGSLAMLEIRSRVVFENDVPTAIHFIARDITERRQLEAQVRQGEKLAALGQLVAGAAHELNNPLAVVLGTTQLLLRDPLAMTFNEDVRNIEAAAQRAKHIVKQMLTFAREQEDVRAPVEVPLLINRVLQGMRLNFQRNAVQVSVTMAPDLPPIWGDAYQLEQVLDNLLHNAVQAIADGPRPSRRVGVEALTLGSMVQLRVSDTGPGILPHVLPRIFDPFFTTKEVGSGTGLGLSLVFGIVDKHGGSIRCESVHGQGATFIVELPAATVAASEASGLISSPTNSTILVVEDEYDVRLILERALSQYGYVVDAVSSGEAALAKIAEKQYDLVITDMRMPGMSGKDLFERVRLTKPQLSWVFITGDTMSASSEAFLKQIGVPFLPKPFTLEELWDAVAASILRDREPLKVD